MANKKLQGLTIEIGGDTTDLSKALKKPNSEANTLQQKLNAVNKALKLDPSNVDLLAQKQRLLADQVEKSKEKLVLLEKAQEDFIQSGKNIDSAEYIELEKQIEQTKSKIKTLSKEQNVFNASIQSFGVKAGEFGEKATNAGKKLSVISAGIIGIGAASQVAWTEIDESFDGIARGTGATGKALEGLKDSFKNVYSQMPDEAGEASSAIADLNTRLGFTGERLEKASIDFLKFASINNTDVSTAIALVTRAMGDANIESSRYNELLDGLTVASQASGISIEKLTEYITKYGAPMRALGYDTKESIAIFASWEKAGVNTEIAFSGMKKAISNYTAEGKNAKEEFKKIVEGIQNGTVSSQEALSVLGAKAGPDLVDAIQQGRFSFEDMLAVVENSSGQMAQTYEDTLDPIDKAKVATNNLKLAGTELATTIQTVLTPIIQNVTDAVKGFTQWFSTLDEGTKEIIVIIAMFIAAIGPLLIFIGKISTGISSIINLGATLGPAFTKLAGIASTAFGMLKTVALGAFNAILAHPIIAGITAIIAIVVLLYTKCEWFRDAVNNVLNSIWEFIKNAFESIKNFLFETVPQMINDVGGWFSQLPGKIWNAVKSLPSMMLSLGGDLVKGIWDGITGMGSWLIDNISGWASDIVDNIASFFGIASPSTIMRDLVGKNLAAGIGKGITENENLALMPMKQLQKEMTSSFNPNINANITKALDYNGTITVESPINVNLDGGPIYQDVVRRTTRNQYSRMIFKGV